MYKVIKVLVVNNMNMMNKYWRGHYVLIDWFMLLTKKYIYVKFKLKSNSSNVKNVLSNIICFNFSNKTLQSLSLIT